MIPDPAQSRSARWRVALTVALVTGVYAAARAIHEPHWPTDFDQLWFAARTLAQGGDPYAVVGPGRLFQWDWPLYYPLPAVLLALPFAALPVAVARVAFSTIAGGVLGWALGGRVRFLWPLLLSAAYLIATSRTQWSPLLLAAAWLPALGFMVTAKPNVGVASIAAMTRSGMTRAIVGCALIALVSLIARPSWFAPWRVAVAVSPHIVAPVLLPGGALLLLAAFRWRCPEARMLLTLACVPHTPSLYDLVVLFYACRTVRDALVLGVLTHVLFWGFVAFGSGATFDAYALNLGKAAVFVVYLPVMAAILRRPNVFEDISGTATEPRPDSWRVYLPATKLDATLLAVLAFGAGMLIWLPLATYR